MNNGKVELFTLHNIYGESVLASEINEWGIKEGRVFKATSYSWVVDGYRFSKKKKSYWRELPDSSGFICFEDDRSVDNCNVLDATGMERYRLSVPLELTSCKVPRGADMWFRNIGTHHEGRFGVTAWIEDAGDFYFELDYHEGRFLWGKKIRF